MNGPETDHGRSILEPFMEVGVARNLRTHLGDLWALQASELPHVRRRTLKTDEKARPVDLASLRSELDLMQHWFDPVASGRRIRQLLSLAPSLPAELRQMPQLIMALPDGRGLMTLEGRSALWLLDSATRRGDLSGPTVTTILLPVSEMDQAERAVVSTYRRWVLARVISVAGLMESETSSFRPTAMGLLLTLLVNRNTTYDRRLPVPDDKQLSAAISAGISGPALAFARTVAGSERASERGLDLYRGWAMGEITRRFGDAVKRTSDGVWIDEDRTEAVLRRLCESISSRDSHFRRRVADGLSLMMETYESNRHLLAALGIAFETPTNTAFVTSAVLRATSDSGGS